MKTFEEYVKQLVKLLEERPETAKFRVVASIDDEGSGFNTIYFDPTVGFLNDDDCFCGEEDGPEGESNAVCVN